MYHRILKILFLSLLTLTTTLCLPALTNQPTNPVITQAVNPQGLLQQGIELYNGEQFSGAIAPLKQAVGAFESQGDSLNVSLALRYLCLAYQHLGDWQAAEGAIAQSLKLLDNQKNLASTPAYLDVFAKVLNTQGRLQWARGQLAEAHQTWKKAAEIYKQLGNNTGVVGSLINQSEALQGLGLSTQAEAELLQVEQVLQAIADMKLKASGLRSLGEAHRRVGNLKKSLEVLQKSLTLAQQFKLQGDESSALLELGNTEQALADRAIAIGKTDEGNQHYENAIQFYQQAANFPDRLAAELNLLSLLVETGKHSEVTQLYPKIQQSLASLPPSRTNIYAQLNFAHSLTKLLTSDRGREKQSHSRFPNTQEIAQILATAIQQARTLKDRTAESYAVGQLGGLYEITQQWSIAENLTQQALLLAEQIQAPEIRYRWEWQMGRLEEKQGEINKAIAAYTDTVDTLKSVRSDLLTINADVQFSFRDNVEPIHRKLVDLLLRSDKNSQPSPENLQRATEVIDSLQLAELENFLNCNLSQSVKLNQDINKIDEKAAFIYPILLEDRLEIISRLPGQPLKRYVTPVNRSKIEKTAENLRGSILRRNRPEAVIENASKLYAWLISPLESDLVNSSQVKTLVFVLDGVLRNIPMSVLYDSKKQEYLMQKPYAIALVPGLQLFDLRPPERERLQVLVAGVSEPRKVENVSFEPLPNVPKEIQEIGTIVRSKSLLNPQFTEENLRQQISSGSFSTVHIATHGKFSSDPEETFILTYNQLLKTSDLNNLLRINNQSRASIIQLLVLSACQTAQGDNRATLGLAGIAVRAGAGSTLATLWQVSDASTSELMVEFYQELTKPELTKAEALHRAMLTVFKQYKAPFYWAPYVLVGNWF